MMQKPRAGERSRGFCISVPHMQLNLTFAFYRTMATLPS